MLGPMTWNASDGPTNDGYMSPSRGRSVCVLLILTGLVFLPPTAYRSLGLALQRDGATPAPTPIDELHVHRRIRVRRLNSIPTQSPTSAPTNIGTGSHSISETSASSKESAITAVLRLVGILAACFVVMLLCALTYIVHVSDDIEEEDEEGDDLLEAAAAKKENQEQEPTATTTNGSASDDRRNRNGNATSMHAQAGSAAAATASHGQAHVKSMRKVVMIRKSSFRGLYTRSLIRRNSDIRPSRITTMTTNSSADFGNTSSSKSSSKLVVQKGADSAPHAQQPAVVPNNRIARCTEARSPPPSGAGSRRAIFNNFTTHTNGTDYAASSSALNDKSSKKSEYQWSSSKGKQQQAE
mmetsp:Transcript_7918/g.14689  ORF Transcript_7918/g.14689 Transcript_7918/m.14689 type:complete len:354 (-) Transcript_7918:160-1221(-)|eukprot:CAMPEP_0197533074 /NCGR_PEP_ID=MMETSP1318-20131121/42190_1 /TAXON_ID=552666 /ORGANISM="Partenskyella glossopodia, Strain RCC365" /LENGTH=353 /DNA_ID=CAMNT_0043089845 /DNA_START=50 /DNA_END=1111 /DNA_ORIENTATION=-